MPSQTQAWQASQLDVGGTPLIEAQKTKHSFLDPGVAQFGATCLSQSLDSGGNNPEDQGFASPGLRDALLLRRSPKGVLLQRNTPAVI